MKLTAEKLPAHLARQLLPVYHLCGDEPLLVNEAADALRAAARTRGFTEREVHFIERGTGWEPVQAAAATLSLFAARRILEIRMPTGKPGVAGARVLENLAGAGRDDLLVIVFTGALDRETQGVSWVRRLEQAGVAVTVAEVGASELTAWLAERCRKVGLEIQPEALEVLAARTEGNLLAARQEIEKLRLQFGTGIVDAAAVLASATDSARFDVAQLGAAIAAGDGGRALRVLAGLRAEGAELPLVLWILNRELRALWRSRRRRLSFPRLAERAVRADRMLKGRLRGDPWDELDLLALEACGRSALPLLSAVRRA